MTISTNHSEISLIGTVGDPFDGFTHADVAVALARIDGNITIRINSGGGDAAEGAAIHAALSAHRGNVAVIVDGIAASAASLIAMAGDTITMSDGAVLMVHDPESITFGNSADHSKSIEVLEAFAVAYARIYAKRSGRSVDSARAIMKAETWYDGPQAVAAGFATSTGGGKPKPYAAFNYRVYARAPAHVVAAKVKPPEPIVIDLDHSEIAASLATMKATERQAATRASWARVRARLTGQKDASEEKDSQPTRAGWAKVLAKRKSVSGIASAAVETCAAEPVKTGWAAVVAKRNAANRRRDDSPSPPSGGGAKAAWARAIAAFNSRAR